MCIRDRRPPDAPCGRSTGSTRWAGGDRRGGRGPCSRTAPAPYPPHWEADIVLAAGGTVHLRPITPADADRLVKFHATLSEQSIYYRFFAFYQVLSDRDVLRFTTVDHHNRCGLVAVLGDELIAVVHYDRIPDLSLIHIS